jgi:uncharacterized coiled-coil protein SlyX
VDQEVEARFKRLEEQAMSQGLALAAISTTISEIVDFINTIISNDG